jgi:hypothetical protein
MQYFFFGELGYFHQVLLACIQRFVKANPQRFGQITLHTFEGNDYIINALWPGYFQFMLYPLHSHRCGWNCPPMEYFFPKDGHIQNMIEDRLPEWLSNISYTGDLSSYYIENPIPCPIRPDLESLQSSFTKTVVLFLRNRSHESFRNYSGEQNSWIELLESQINNPSTLCCIYSVSSTECIIPPFVNKDAKNIYFIKTMEEATYFFHKCDTAYMNNTGLEDFAKNCRVKHLVVCPPPNKLLFNATPFYNPFHTKIEIFGEYTLSH